MNSTVSLSKVCKSYTEGNAKRQVLHELDLRIEKAETVALLGASGSGKSTLLNILAGLTEVDSGSVNVSGTDLVSLSKQQRTFFRREKIGFVFQFFHLVPTLTVEENLRLPLQLNNQDNSKGQLRIQKLLERVGLSDRARTFPDRLSGGEQQRVAVCRSLVHQPAVILADEPTGNLDKKTAVDVLSLILELAAEQETTLLLVTHSQDVASNCQKTFRLPEGSFLNRDTDF